VYATKHKKPVSRWPSEAQRIIEASELEAIAKLWLALVEAATDGDYEARVFLAGTFGPWATEIMRTHAH
jgi:hypothetical protein